MAAIGVELLTVVAVGAVENVTVLFPEDGAILVENVLGVKSLGMVGFAVLDVKSWGVLGFAALGVKSLGVLGFLLVVKNLGVLDFAVLGVKSSGVLGFVLGVKSSVVLGFVLGVKSSVVLGFGVNPETQLIYFSLTDFRSCLATAISRSKSTSRLPMRLDIWEPPFTNGKQSLFSLSLMVSICT